MNEEYLQFCIEYFLFEQVVLRIVVSSFYNGKPPRWYIFVIYFSWLFVHWFVLPFFDEMLAMCIACLSLLNLTGTPNFLILAVFTFSITIPVCLCLFTVVCNIYITCIRFIHFWVQKNISLWCDKFAVSLRPEDIGNQARVLLVEFIRQRMIRETGLETVVTEDQLMSPDSPRGS